MSVSRIGMIFNDVWKIVRTKRVNDRTNYILENIVDGRCVEVCQPTLNSWIKDPKKVNVERLMNKKFVGVETSVPDHYKIRQCRENIRKVARCEDCLRFYENCETLACIVEREK